MSVSLIRTTVRSLGLAAAASLVAAAPGFAQIPIMPGQAVSGVVEASDPLAYLGEFSYPHDCYTIDLPEGSSWEVELTNRDLYLNLSVGRGESCANLQVDMSVSSKIFANRARAAFELTSGGGRYLLRIFKPNPLIVRSVEYSVALQPAAGGKRLPPGAVVQAVDLNNTETASTAASPEAASFAAGQTVQDCPNCPSMIVVPAGIFFMGSTVAEEGRGRDEGPRHPVTFANPFAIGRAEVSFDEWNACVADNGCSQKPADGGWGQGKQPVVNVTWNDAMGYAAWLSKKTGQKYFLPSESEWEYAARAGGETAWNTGEAIVTDDANFLSAVGQPVPVASYPANAFGLHDLHGNVAEWVRDCHKAIGYFGAPNNGGIADEANCATRVQRGGDWASEPAAIRSARRAPAAPLTRGTTVGFRVARAL